MKLYAAEADPRVGSQLKGEGDDPFHGLAQFHTNPWLYKPAMDQVWGSMLGIILLTFFIKMLFARLRK
jgi:hypothetical protein